MLIPWTAVRTVDEHVGLGVFATRPIPAGTLVWVEDSLDVRIPAQAVRNLVGPMREAIYRSAYQPHGADYYLLCWDAAKYLNHCCEPNCLSVTPEAEIAVRDIAAGEQLSNHYAFFGLEPWEAFDCRCGASSCSGSIHIRPDPAIAWRLRELVDVARRRACRVEQPLEPLVATERTRPLARRRRHRGLLLDEAAPGPGAALLAPQRLAFGEAP
jgi:hypothetical protein